jgi:hypothetical protein
MTIFGASVGNSPARPYRIEMTPDQLREQRRSSRPKPLIRTAEDQTATVVDRIKTQEMKRLYSGRSFYSGRGL